MTDDEILTSDLGGELGDMIDRLSGNDFDCTCSHSFELGRDTNFVGYIHNGGLADKVGVKYWLYTVCPDCGYQWAWHKIEAILVRAGVLK